MRTLKLADKIVGLTANNKATSLCQGCLNDEQYHRFSIFLCTIVYPRHHSATASQRAEAFLRTLSLWKGEQ